MGKGFSGVFLPIEVLHRELVSKSLLAARLAAMKIPVYIGHKADTFNWLLMLSTQVYFINKSVGYKNNRELYKSLWDKGFRITKYS
jgi:hypothetical protein